jgi:hypothetical protein
MCVKKVVLIIGIVLVLLIISVNADVPPCISTNNPYFGPIEPGYDTKLEYPAGYYDLWFAELPMKFSTSDAANYKKWDWEVIEDVQIKSGKQMNVFLGLVGDKVESYSDWILGYESVSAKSGWGAVYVETPSGRSSRWAIVLC